MLPEWDMKLEAVYESANRFQYDIVDGSEILHHLGLEITWI